MVVIEFVWKFLVGYVENYYWLILTVCFTHFCGPTIVDWIVTRMEERDRLKAGERAASTQSKRDAWR